MLPWLLASALAAWPDRCDLPEVDPGLPDRSAGRALFLVAGHGTATNRGNIGVRGQVEAEVTLALAESLGRTLAERGGFAVHMGRRAGESPSYDARLARLEASAAPVMIELHTDSRPEHTYVWAGPDGEVLRNDAQPGFSVLYNDSGPHEDARRALAVALGAALVDRGLLPYTGGYGSFYDPVADAPGVYIDRRGLKMLRAPAVPSVIIETHHALDPREVACWDRAETHQAFAEAVEAGLSKWFATSASGADPQVADER